MTHALGTAHRKVGKLFSFLFVLILALSLSTSQSRAEGFSSTPVTTVYPLQNYTYNVTLDTNWGNTTMTTTADWLVFNGTAVLGLPTEDDIGIYLVNLTCTNDTATEYQNYSVAVLPLATDTSSNIYLILGLVFGFGSIGLGMFSRRFMFLAGIIWIFVAIAVLADYGVPWAIIGVGFGLVLLADGATHMDEGG